MSTQCRSSNVTSSLLNPGMWINHRKGCVIGEWQWMKDISLPPSLSRCDSAPPMTRGKWHKTCHPESQPGLWQLCSYVNVSAYTDSWAGHISLNMHVQHWLKRKHLCTCRSRYICMYVSRLMVCMSKLIPVCHSDIPSGKVPHDCFHLLDCPYVFMSAG